MPAIVAGPGKAVTIEGAVGSLGKRMAAAEKPIDWYLAIVLKAGALKRRCFGNKFDLSCDKISFCIMDITKRAG